MAGLAKTGNRKIEGLRVRKLNGKVVRPVLYNGCAVGHSKYFTGAVDDQLVLDENGKPIPFRQIGQLELA